jgi:hypothetical protein
MVNPEVRSVVRLETELPYTPSSAGNHVGGAGGEAAEHQRKSYLAGSVGTSYYYSFKAQEG